MRFIILFLSAIFLLSACQKTETKSQNTSENAKRYTLKGKVISVDKEKKTALIQHNAIPEMKMEAMTMPFLIKADWVWDDLKPGAEISSADLVVDESNMSYWLENIALVLAANPNQPAPPIDERFAQVGKEVPEFTLTNQDGKRISTKDFKGKTWALTFIYARCPLPEACPRMSANFADAALEIMKSDYKDKMRLLSISFDPANDTPEKLRSYGQGYLGKDAKPDFSVWQLAVGSDAEVKRIADFLGLRYETDQNDKTIINHSLRTAVIAPDGKVIKIISGGDWTGNDLLGEMKIASGS